MTIPSLFSMSSLVCCTGMVELSGVSIVSGAEAKDAPSELLFLLGTSAKGGVHAAYKVQMAKATCYILPW